MADKPRTQNLQRIFYLGFLLLISGGLAYLAVIWPMTAAPETTKLAVGEVASQDILAPYAISYTSDVLTEKQREAAERTVIPRYTSADTNVARQQLEHMRAALAYISSTRGDSYASDEEKLADLAALEDIHLKQETGINILALTDARWQAVQQEAIVVLEQVMRSTIREDRLEDARRSVPNLVSLSLPEDQATIVAEIVSAFIAPNSIYSESLTETARQEAIEAVAPVLVSFASGESIIGRGEIVSEDDIEALQKLGLAQPEARWQDQAGAIAVVLLSMVIVLIYFRHKPGLVQDQRGLTLITITFLIFLLGARFFILDHVVLPYLYPISAFALIIAALFGNETALILTIPLIILTTYGYPTNPGLILYYGVSSLVGVLIPKREQRIIAFLWVGLTVAASGAATITVYELIQSDVDGIGVATLAGAAAINGTISAGLTVLLQYFLAPLLGLTTPLQLVELSRPDNPLLEHLLRYAPGTYQHSLQVANLAEQAAEGLDADSLLTRVGALYHDVGKSRNPQFFIENQIVGPLDPHDDIEPAESAAIIIRHVADGIELANEHHLPRRIQDFITEHHGTLRTQYQLTQAIKDAGGNKEKVDPSPFEYPGPRPQSRETALVMLADGCEARVRSQRPANEKELREMVKDTIDTRIAEGQLDDTSLTLHDIRIIVDSYTATLRGMYHPRVEYPSLEPPTKPTPKKVVEEAIYTQIESLEVEDETPTVETEKPE
jgi:putative nucleotidyltransferase with HDIG domain